MTKERFAQLNEEVDYNLNLIRDRVSNGVLGVNNEPEEVVAMSTIEESNIIPIQEHKIKTLRKELSFAMRLANSRYKEIQHMKIEKFNFFAEITRLEKINKNLLNLLNGKMNLILIACGTNLMIFMGLVSLLIYISK
jgi:hypothetical protein